MVDPRHIELVDYAALWLQLTPGTDAALVNGMMNIIINEGWADQEFIAKRCENYDELWEVVKNYTPDVVSEITGVPEDKIRAAAELYAHTAKAGIFYTLGITEHTTGTANVMNLANLAMVTGHVGVPHAGVNPLRGQNNVQGACDMGALPNVFSGLSQRSPSRRTRPSSKRPGASRSTRDLGCASRRCSTPCIAGELKAMYIMGEDPMLTDADANHVRRRHRGSRLPRGPGHLHDRDGQVRRRGACRPPATPRRTAPSPTPSAASSGCARRWSPGRGPGRLGDHPRPLHPHGLSRWHYDSPADIFEEIRTSRPPTRA